MNVIVSDTGQISVSVDGLGTVNASGLVQVSKPPTGTVRSAHFFCASRFGSGPIGNGTITLDSAPITFTSHVVNGSWDNHYADVTALLTLGLNAAPAGITNLTIGEAFPLAVDGCILAVIFNDPAQAVARTVALLFGGQATAGDVFVSFTNPINLSDPNFVIDMGLGISYGFQGTGAPTHECGTQQPQGSQIDVNSVRVTSCAGNFDDADGSGENGNLLTVGGMGDSNNNPTDANQAPADGGFPRTQDDELYDLRPFVQNGGTSLTVNSLNPSNDDNIFFSYIVTLEATVTVPLCTGGAALVGCWKFDENGGTAALDSSGGGNHGTLVNAPAWATGHSGSAIQFDGADDYVSVPDASILDLATNDFTLSAWVYLSGIPSEHDAIISKMNLGCAPGYYFAVLPNQRLVLELDSTTSCIAGQSTLTVPTLSWHHAAVTFQRSSVATFYLDGNAAGTINISASAGSIANTRPLTIGAVSRTNGPISFFAGKIDQVKIWDRALSASEIAAEAGVADPDTDGDGCLDVEETGTDHILGGQRDPLYFWDFYDVDGTKSVGLSDALLILQHFGHAGTGSDGVPLTDHNLLDRHIPNVADGWLSAEESNGIGLADALANLRSFGDSCSGPPN